ncbi:MAG: hypothetical protein ACTMIK_10355 [Galactobacter sp.]
MSETVQRAKDVYVAALEAPEHQNPVAKAGRFVAGLASAAFGDDGSAFSGVSVVIRRLDDHAVLSRVDAGDYESDEALLAIVNESLEDLSAEEFARTWASEEA